MHLLVWRACTRVFTFIFYSFPLFLLLFIMSTQVLISHLKRDRPEIDRYAEVLLSSDLHVLQFIEGDCMTPAMNHPMVHVRATDISVRLVDLTFRKSPSGSSCSC